MKKKNLILTAIILFIVLHVSAVNSETQPDDTFIIWSHSDIQPKKENHLTNFPMAVDDIAANIGHIDIAITAGDIVEKSNSEELYKTYLETRKKIDADAWFEIAGNHEWRNIDNYKKIINSHLNYSVSTGNMLLLFMSNSESGQMTIIPDNIFQWWKRMVIENQDKIIITVTHGSLKNSGLFQSRLWIKRQFIKDSDRFEDVLKNYSVDLWISGHSHLPGYFPYSLYKNNSLGGTVFIDNGAIREELLSGVESRVLYFYPGTDRVVIKHREHSDHSFSDSLERKFRLSKIFLHRKGDKIIVSDVSD